MSLAATAAVLSLCIGAVWLRAARNEAQAEAQFPPVGQILQVNGTPVHVMIGGTGPDLVLIHGAGGNLRDMRFDLLAQLRDRYRVILFDRPGHGYTGHPGDAQRRRNESPREQAQLLQAAAQQLGVKNPIVLGHSFGGAVAMAWALEFPAQVSALVLLAGATLPWDCPLKPSYRINAHPLIGAVVVPLITALVPDRITRRVMAAIFAPQEMPPGYLDAFGLALTLRRDTMIANARQVNALRAHLAEMSVHYPSITVPIELLHGTADRIVGLDVHSKALAARMPNAHLTVLEGIGHIVHHARPAQVTAAIDRAASRAGLSASAQAASLNE
ncbi:alpha/beta fold hydrolase [Pseudoruegeria sp. SK021]|uniref:alpha/beta fold hydrolase n=1 Tax=Pseudoruegeria sp. SK021 TaxID=1933035 RepID=UPI000A222C7E|nr:alpha/beta hydrolase [Pseudoruegeria sp. SK021]OSP55547.1 alpha/beta hydrolase [Pseudoruegeria sp. SK021]